MNNPFPYSNDNKRYQTWNYYLRKTYGKKVYKIALNADFTCPNRDGHCGVGGCLFCSEKGSGDFAGDVHDSLLLQFKKGYSMLQKKYPGALAIAYFQSFSNTYASLEKIKQTYQPFIKHPQVTILSIATRADCLSDEIIEYLDQACDEKEIWLEIGLQSIHDVTASAMNRGHDYATFVKCINTLSRTRLKICVHLMNSLPKETPAMMIQSAKALASLPIHALKIHMLHVIQDSALSIAYIHHPFELLDYDSYIDTLIAQLEVLPPTMVIQRVSGDADAFKLLAPDWTRNKKAVLNGIDKEMKQRNTWQGKLYQKP